MSTGNSLGHRYGKKRRVLRNCMLLPGLLAYWQYVKGGGRCRAGRPAEVGRIIVC